MDGGSAGLQERSAYITYPLIILLLSYYLILSSVYVNNGCNTLCRLFALKSINPFSKTLYVLVVCKLPLTT